MHLQDEVDVDVEAMQATVFPFGLRYEPGAHRWKKQVSPPTGKKDLKKRRAKEP